MRQAAWVLCVSVSTLGDWNKGFDENFKPLVVPDNRGKTAKVTIEIVRLIVDKAKGNKARGKRIRIKQFAADLKSKEGINLAAKTVEHILIANDLYKAHTRKKRPRFYQSLCRKIPNGLLSLDGSDMIVWLGETPHRFNVELAVDVVTFAHTAFSVAETETAEQVIKVLDSHRNCWGLPIGVLYDHGSANISAEVQRYLHDLGIEPVPAGPGNPKGNGTDEGAFSQMKKALRTIRLDISSPKALAQSVLEALISVYVYMRNQMPVRGANASPAEHMAVPVTDEQRNRERQELINHVAAKVGSEEDQLKLDRLHWVIRHHGLDVSAEALKRAQRSIKAYELEAIRKTEAAFLKATSRKADRLNLPYFFGILKNIQQQRDDEAKRQYCRERYNYQMMLDLDRRKNEQSPPLSINDVIGMLEKAVTVKVRFVKELAIRKAREWTHELMESCQYLGSLRKKIEDALGDLRHLTIEQKQKAWELFCQFLNNKNLESRVTPSS
jgi:transposase InsO family protein